MWIYVDIFVDIYVDIYVDIFIYVDIKVTHLYHALYMLVYFILTPVLETVQNQLNSLNFRYTHIQPTPLTFGFMMCKEGPKGKTLSFFFFALSFLSSFLACAVGSCREVRKGMLGFPGSL